MINNAIYLLALIFAIAGITLGFITSNWLILPIILIAIGVVIAIINLIVASKKKTNFLAKNVQLKPA